MLIRYPALAVVLALLITSALCAEDDAKYDLHEFSLWGLDPTLEQANELQHYPSAMPGVVETDRSRANEARKLTPLSVLTLHGEPVKDLEIDLRVQSGRFVGHWPPAESKSGRLRWLDVSTVAERDKDALFASVDDKHWFNEARELDALFVKDKSRSERFLTYDCELKYELPVQVTAGPDKYLVTNSSKHPLFDLFIVVPQDEGMRIGHLESLPPSKPKAGQVTEPKAQPTTPAAEAKPTDKPAAKSVTPSAPTTSTPQPPAKTEADAPADKAEVKEEKKEEEKVDEANRAAAAVAAAIPAPVAAPGAVVAAPVGAVPGVAAPGQPAAAPAAPAVPLEPTELVMSPLLSRDSDEFKAVGETLTTNLLKLGLSQQEVDLLIQRAGSTLLESKEMMVFFRLPVEAIEERLPLIAYPAPRKTVRTALVAVRNLDPKIKDEVQKLVAQLGSPDYSQREDAEKRLTDLGRLAVPALKTALKSNDLEIVFRAERILLAQNEKLEGT